MVECIDFKATLALRPTSQFFDKKRVLFFGSANVRRLCQAIQRDAGIAIVHAHRFRRLPGDTCDMLIVEFDSEVDEWMLRYTQWKAKLHLHQFRFCQVHQDAFTHILFTGRNAVDVTKRFQTLM